MEELLVPLILGACSWSTEKNLLNVTQLLSLFFLTTPWESHAKLGFHNYFGSVFFFILLAKLSRQRNNITVSEPHCHLSNHLKDGGISLAPRPRTQQENLLTSHQPTNSLFVGVGVGLSNILVQTPLSPERWAEIVRQPSEGSKSSLTIRWPRGTIEWLLFTSTTFLGFPPLSRLAYIVKPKVTCHITRQLLNVSLRVQLSEGMGSNSFVSRCREFTDNAGEEFVSLWLVSSNPVTTCYYCIIKCRHVVGKKLSKINFKQQHVKPKS